MVQTTYEKSNAVTNVRLNSFNKSYAKAMLSSKENRTDRLRKAQKLLDYLCDKFKIASVSVEVTDNKRPLKWNSAQVYGKYYPSVRHIVIYNTTAKTNKTISIKSFYDTLLHEFIHHYDFCELEFTESPHTKGFYMRIKDLKEKLGC